MAPLDADAIARLVKSERERHDLTQAELAEAAGVTDETVSRVERGANEPSLSTVAALADAFGLTLDAMVGRTEIGDPQPGSPLLRRLTLIAARLDEKAQRALIQLAELLPRGKKA
jgi:transcriptional regulator with XRE-family HTH domain